MTARADQPRIRVLLTGGGGAGTIEVIKRLRASGRYHVATADASPYAAGFAYAHAGYVVPFGASNEFEGALRDLLDRERPRFVIPLVDEEIPIVHRLVATEYASSVTVVAPRGEFCDIALDKWESYRALRSADIPTPTSWLASDAGDCTFPAVIKPRDGRGSRGVAFLEDRDDLARYLARTDRAADRFVVQERLFGREYTTSVVVALGGPLLAVVPKEAIEKRGITYVGVTREVPEIEQLGRDLQDRLCANGPFNVQLVMGADRVPRVIELNPRYSTTVALTIGAGLDEVDAVLRHACGDDPGQLSFRPGVLMVRYHTQLFMPADEWPPAQPEGSDT